MRPKVREAQTFLFFCRTAVCCVAHMDMWLAHEAFDVGEWNSMWQCCHQAFQEISPGRGLLRRTDCSRMAPTYAITQRHSHYSSSPCSFLFRRVNICCVAHIDMWFAHETFDVTRHVRRYHLAGIPIVLRGSDVRHHPRHCHLSFVLVHSRLCFVCCV